jgi:maltooligosyltrehalose trehalohydrolase
LNDPRLLQARERGGFALDAQWSDDFHHALHAVLTGERTGYYGDFGALADLAKALHNAYVYDGRYSAYRQRHQGRPPVGLEGERSRIARPGVGRRGADTALQARGAHCPTV